MTAIDNYDLANDLDFRKRVKMLALKSALAIAGESNEGKQPIYIDKRASTANYIIYEQDRAAEIIHNVICALGTLTINSSDADIEWSINSVWDDLSRVYYVDTLAL